MKIALPALPQWASQALSSGSSPADSNLPGADGFAHLLAQMLMPTPAETGESMAAEIAPGMGASTQAFQNARMLVETALHQSRTPTPAPRDTAEPASPTHLRLLQKLESLLSGSPKTTPLAEQGVSGSVGTPLAQLSPALTNSHQAAELRFHGPQLPLVVPPNLVRTPVSNPTAEKPPAGPAELQTLPAHRLQSAPPAPAKATEGQASSLSARLLSTDGGLILLLRLPRLDASERAELEGGANRLLQGLGLKRHQIVIQEIAEGQG